MQTPVYNISTTTPITVWPAGTNQGDLAIYVVIGYSGTADATGHPYGWTYIGQIFDYDATGSFMYVGRVYWQNVHTAAPTTAQWTYGPVYHRLIVIPGAREVIEVKYGRRSAQVPPGAGLLVFSAWPNDAAFQGLTLQPELMQVTVGPFSVLRAKIGWATDSGSGGVIGALYEFLFSWIFRCLTLVIGPPRGPSRPLLVAPISEVSTAVPVSFSWVHQQVVTGGSQTAYELRSKLAASGIWLYWSVATAQLTTTETVNVTATSALTLSASLFTADAAQQWQVKTQEAVDSLWSPWSDVATFTPVTPPSVTVTSATTWTGDLTPTVTWTPVMSGGRVQIAFRVRVLSSTGVVLLDTGWQSGAATTYTVPVLAWANGVAGTQKVSVRQSGGAASPEASAALTVSWTSPSTPTVTAAPSSEGIAVTVTVPGGVATTLVELQRLDETWVSVLTKPYGAGPLIVHDVVAPYGQSRFYRAQATNILDGVPLSSAFGTLVSAVTSNDRAAYLVNSTDQTDYLRVTLITDGARKHVQETTLNYGLGLTDEMRPWVEYSTPQGMVGTFTFRVNTPADLATLLMWVSTPRTLVFKMAPDAGIALPLLRFVVTSQREETRLQQVNTTAMREVSFDWAEQ
jgi:hypothetical protein